MHIEIKPVDMTTEADALSAMDKVIFPPGDSFDDPDLWRDYECFWIVVDGQIAGSIAMGLNMECGESWEEAPCPGCLYIASTGILPQFQRKGIGTFVKQWQIDYAKAAGFNRISTNCRQSNVGSLRLNQKFGFGVVEEIPDFYENPTEAAMILELPLPLS